MDLKMTGLCVLFCVVTVNAFLTDTPYCSHGQPLQDVFCGRGPTRQNCPTNYVCHVHPADAWAVCCPTGTRQKRSNKQLDTLRNKLSNLQDLLLQIEKDETHVTTIPTTTQQEEIDKGRESRMFTSKERESPKEGLTSGEVAILKALRNTINRRQNQKLGSESKLRQELEILSINTKKGRMWENKGSFYDRPMIEEGADDVSVLKALANELSKNEKTKIESHNKDNSLSKDENPQPKEGKFSVFRQEVLAQIEDRLLQDIDFALKTGFSIEEIVEDLTEKEKRFKELQLEEMQSRIEKLRNSRD